MGVLDDVSSKIKTTTCFCWSLETCVNVQGYVWVVSSLLMMVISAVFIAVNVRPASYGYRFAVVLEIAFSCALICSVISLVVAVILLRGIFVRNPCLMKPYMVFSALRIITLTIGVYLILILSDEKAWAIIPILVTPLEMYFWLHVHRLYKTLGESQSSPVVAQLANAPPFELTEA